MHLKKYIKIKLLENKPLSLSRTKSTKGNLIEKINLIYDDFLSEIYELSGDMYLVAQASSNSRRLKDLIAKSYKDIRVYSRVFLSFIQDEIDSMIYQLEIVKKHDMEIEKNDDYFKFESFFIDLEKNLDLVKNHKERVWDYLSYNDKNNIIKGKTSFDDIEDQYATVLSKKLLKSDIHKKIIENKSHGEIIFEDEDWTFVLPRTELGSLAWATSYHDGSKEDLRSDLKDKVSWCTASFGKNWWKDYSKYYVLVYCIAKDYQKLSPYRKFTLGFVIDNVFEDDSFLDIGGDVTMDAYNDKISNEEIKSLINTNSLEKIIDIIKKVCIVEKGAISDEVKKFIDEFMKDIISEKLDNKKTSSKIREAIEEILEDARGLEYYTLSIKKYIKEALFFYNVNLEDFDKEALKKKYNIKLNNKAGKR